MNRMQLGLLALLVAQIALIAVCRSTASGPTTPEALFPGLDTNSIRKLSIEEPADKKVTTLVRAGGGWTVAEADGFPADATRIDQLIETLQRLQVSRAVVTNKRYHEAFAVEDAKANARVRAWTDPAADPVLDLLVGSSSNYRATHVRRASDDSVYEVRDLAAYDVRADRGSWIDKALIDAAPDQVRRLSLTNAHGTFEIERGDNSWRAADGSGAALDTSKVEAFLGTVTNLRLADASGVLDEVVQGFVSATATLRLWVAKPALIAAEGAEAETPAAGESEIVIRVGSTVAGREGERYITRSGLAYAGTIWEGSLTRLFEDRIQTFAPTVEPGP